MKVLLGSIVFAVVIIGAVFYGWKQRDINECHYWLDNDYKLTSYMKAQCKELGLYE
jgi:hypothetical protein